MSLKKISILVPCYNEFLSIDSFQQTLLKILGSIQNYTFEVIFINDGSTDQTMEKLQGLMATHPIFKIIELSRNFGKEAALTAGIDFATGDAVIPIDVDLQDPPELLHAFITEWEKGFEVVLAKRLDRSSDHVLKRRSASWFYKVHNALADTPIPDNVGDFRLMDRCVVDAIKQMPERQRFMKGIFAWVGFKTTTVHFKRESRQEGTSNFSPWKLWNLALDGLTSFTTAPLRIWTYLGFLGSLFTLSYAFYIIVRTTCYGVDVPGYASIFVAVLFMGSLQLISTGILGEYIGRIYHETKQRPNYIVRQFHTSELS